MLFGGLALFVCGLLVTQAQVYKGDAQNRIILTSPVALNNVYVTGYRTGITTVGFKDTLSLISVSNYSYDKVRQFDTVGQWRLKFEYQDSSTSVQYSQWQTVQVLPDTLSQQGAASGLTAQAIWHYADGTDTGRTVFGFGGTGNRKTTLTFANSADSVAIQGVEVKVKTTSGNAHKGGSKLSDANGQAVFYLPTSTGMTISATHNNYTFSPTVFNTNANVTDTTKTIYGTLFNPGAPPDGRLVRVWGYVRDINYTVVIGVTVTAELQGARKIWYKTVPLSPYTRKDTTDATGYWELNLLPNDSLTPSNSSYQIIQYDSTGEFGRYSIRVPGDSTGKAWQLPSTIR